MKSYLAEMVRGSSPWDANSLSREYLQARILAAMQRAGAMIPLAFHGGTALRFLYQLGRFSEDMDFALERAHDVYCLRRYLQAIGQALRTEGYSIELRLDQRRVVHTAWVRFPGLPYELGISPHPSQILAIKIEVDTQPPAGAGLSTTLVRRHVLLQLQHHDRASLLSGKLHAILQRPYSKGRDLYDLLWYLCDPQWPEPNLVLLNNALAQTGWMGGRLDQTNWRPTVKTQVEQMDWQSVLQDVRPFLPPHETDLLTKENVIGALDRSQH